MNGGQSVVDWMAKRGVSHFFHVPGESFLPVLDALRDQPRIQVVTCRHESGAAFAAEGFGKAAGRPAVCMATRGPGASNLSIGVQTAFYDSTPLVALVGLVPRRLQGTRAFQEFDPLSLFASIAKQVLMVNDPAALPVILDKALATATGGRPGPVVVGLPTDVLSGDAPSAGVARRAGMVPAIDAAHLMEAVLAARRPILLAATGAVRGGAARSIGELALRTGLPVFAAWRRYSAIAGEHPNFVGGIGIGAAQSVRAAIDEADLVVSFGFALEQITVQSAGLDREELRVVQVAPAFDPPGVTQAGRAAVEEHLGDPAAAAAELLCWCDANPDRVRDFQARQEPATRDWVTRSRQVAGEPGDALDASFQALDRSLPEDAMVTSDAGNFAQWLVRRIRFGGGRTFLGPVNGAMGYGLPAAIGAVLATPGRPAWCIAGDGGFLMTVGEMETATRLQLDLAAVVVDNHRYGTIRARQELEFPGRVSGTALGSVDFAALARSMGWSARTAQAPAEFSAAMAATAAESGCRLVHLLLPDSPLGLE